MKSKCITTPANSRLILVEDWMIVACDGNHCAAMLMSFMIYWHDVRLSQVEKSRQQNEIAEGHGDTATQDTSLLQFHNERELELGLLGIYKSRTITDALHVLTEKEFVERHSNPNPRYHFDRTRYFLLKPQNIQHWIENNFATMSRSEVDHILAPERERQKRRTDTAKMPDVVNNESSHRQNCSTVKQESNVALQNRSVLHEITTFDYSQDSLGDIDIPQTPSLVENPKANFPLANSAAQSVHVTGGAVSNGIHHGNDRCLGEGRCVCGEELMNKQPLTVHAVSSTTTPPDTSAPPTPPMTDHQQMMEALQRLTGQKILNGAAQGKAAKKILTAYSVAQAIEVLEWMVNPNSKWIGKADWLSVQNFIGEYFRRQTQQQFKTTQPGGITNGKSKLWEFCNRKRALGDFG